MIEVVELEEISEVRPMAVSAEGFDPLTCNVTWRNNKLSAGLLVGVAVLFGTLEGETFTPLGFEHEGYTYAWGVVTPTETAPSAGSTKTTTLLTYALNPSSPISVDALVIVGEFSYCSARSFDYGYGERMVGIRIDTLETMFSEIYAQAGFQDVIALSPMRPAVEIQSLNISIG